MEDLIDSSLVILSDITKEEPNMDVLNNAKNRAIDSYRTTKWTFHEIHELKYRVGRLERDNNIIMNKQIEEDKEMNNRVEDVNRRVQSIEGTLLKIADQSYNILNASNDNIKVLITKIEEHRGNMEGEQSPNSEKEKIPENGTRKRTRSSMKKEAQVPNKDLSDLKEVAGRMSELEICATEILKETT